MNSVSFCVSEKLATVRSYEIHEVHRRFRATHRALSTDGRVTVWVRPAEESERIDLSSCRENINLMRVGVIAFSGKTFVIATYLDYLSTYHVIRLFVYTDWRLCRIHWYIQHVGHGSQGVEDTKATTYPPSIQGVSLP